MQLRRAKLGFTLTEMAVVIAIITLLIGGAMATLSSIVDQRNADETNRRLNAAVDALIGYAVVKKRLPCPARFTSTVSHSQGQESFCAAATGTCVGSETTTEQAHGNCSNFYDGYLPAATIGALPVDAAGFLVDPWGNRIRYAVARDFLTPSCTTTPPADTRIWTSQANLKAYGVACRPSDLDVCASATNTNPTSCNTATRVVSVNTVGFVVFSTGKNGSTGSNGADELENTDGDSVFVSRPPTTTDAAAGVYDDIMVMMPVGVFYQKLISAGVLP